jgi:hypothetical protein
MIRLLLKNGNGNGYDDGDIVCAFGGDHVWSPLEGAPDFVQVDVPDMTLAEANALRACEYGTSIDGKPKDVLRKRQANIVVGKMVNGRKKEWDICSVDGVPFVTTRADVILKAAELK